MGRQVAARVAAGQGEAMGRAVLALYRSAAGAGAPGLGLVLERAALVRVWPSWRRRTTSSARKSNAARAGARVAVLDGLGHWWMTEDPDRGAAALTRFWSAIR
ncbi:MAG: hypothetical protein QOI78_836 [Actinomycetota bacterium]|nr:hypothetical protein [Actinomycetota bacterium]